MLLGSSLLWLGLAGLANGLLAFAWRVLGNGHVKLLWSSKAKMALESPLCSWSRRWDVVKPAADKLCCKRGSTRVFGGLSGCGGPAGPGTDATAGMCGTAQSRWAWPVRCKSVISAVSRLS